MIDTMSNSELDDALRSTQERMRQLLNERHRRATDAGPPAPDTMGTVVRRAALHALRADRKSVLAFLAIVVLMLGVAVINAIKTMVGP
jgi:hypothetical protein